MSKTGLVLSIIIALALPISWAAGKVVAARSKGIRIPVKIAPEEPLRRIMVRVRNR